MQHPTEPLAARDATTGWRCRRQRQDPAIVEPLVIPFVVVVRDELAAGATQRALADQDHALEGIVKLTKSSSIDPQDTGLEPAVNPPCWASRTAARPQLDNTLDRGGAIPVVHVVDVGGHRDR